MTDTAVAEAILTPTTTSTTTLADGGADWMTTIPPELQSEPSVQLFKGKPVAEVVKSYVESQKAMGSSIRLPKPDAPPEERDRALADVYGKLGRPDSPDKYVVPPLPDGIAFNEPAVKAFFADAHKTGMTQGQAGFVLQHYATIVKAAQAEQARLATKSADEASAALKTEWGADFDANLAQAQRFTADILGDEVYGLLREKGLDNHPAIVKKFGALGGKFAETARVGGDTSGANGGDARTKLEAIYADKAHLFHKGDMKASEEVLALQRAILGANNKTLFTYTK